MERIETVEDVLVETESLIDKSYDSKLILSDTTLLVMVNTLAKEIKELKKQVAEQKLLIEHEEAVRTTKAHSTQGGHNITPTFKEGDIVDYNLIGTNIWAKSKVISFHHRNRIQIELLESKARAGLRGARRTVGPKQLRYHQSV